MVASLFMGESSNSGGGEGVGMGDDDVTNPLLAQIREGESLLWTGRSNPECYLAQQRKEAALFFGGGACSMCVVGFISFAVTGSSRFTVYLFVIGIFSLFALGAKNCVAPKWWYAVTDQRVLSDYPTEDAEMIWQVPLALIRNVRLKDHTRNVGTIVFNSFFVQRKECGSFDCIDDAQIVYALITSARRSALAACPDA